MPMIRIVRPIYFNGEEAWPPEDTNGDTHINISEDILATALTLHAASTPDALQSTREAIVRPIVEEHEDVYSQYGANPWWENDEPAVDHYRIRAGIGAT